MGKARRVQGLRSALVVAAICAIAFGGITMRSTLVKRQREIIAEQREQQNAAQAAQMVKGLLQADTSQVKTIVENLADFRRYAADDLSKAFAEFFRRLQRQTPRCSGDSTRQTLPCCRFSISVC